ncbi:hypothetical protein [Rahnella inusitata]|uniref:hypothetical protein n=1 Tax=Rahnella inusitata TaxID=58169 RepID=UPI0039BE183C
MSIQRTWIQNPLAVFTANELDARGGIVIEGTKITEVLAVGQSPSQPVDQVFDATDCVLMPGLINTHHHFYQTLTRAWAPVVNVPLFPWLKKLYPVWARLQPEALGLASRVAMAELLLSVAPLQRITIICSRREWKRRSMCKSKWCGNWACALY